MKNYKLFFLCLLITFLDVAILPFGCGPGPNMDEKVMVQFNVLNASVMHDEYNYVETDLRVGDIITEDKFDEIILQFLKEEKFHYTDPENVNGDYSKIQIRSYTISKITLCGEQHTFDEITIPHEIKEGDFAIYYQGIRNVLLFNVDINIDYILVEEG